MKELAHWTAVGIVLLVILGMAYCGGKLIQTYETGGLTWPRTTSSFALLRF